MSPSARLRLLDLPGAHPLLRAGSLRLIGFETSRPSLDIARVAAVSLLLLRLARGGGHPLVGRKNAATQLPDGEGCAPCGGGRGGLALVDVVRLCAILLHPWPLETTAFCIL